MLTILKNAWSWLTDQNNLVLLGLVFTIFGISVLGFFGKLIKFIFFRPHLKLRFIPEETYHERLEVGRQKQSLWMHLMCFNNGFIEARNLKGYITKIYEFNESTASCTRNNNFLNQIGLKWAHENDYLPKNILRRSNKRLDVCFIYEDLPTLYFSTKYYPSGTQLALAPGSYVFEIVVMGSNTAPAKYYLHVEWQGTWKNLKQAKPLLKNFKVYKDSPAIIPFRLYKPKKKEKQNERATVTTSTENQPVSRDSWTTRAQPSQAPDGTETMWTASN